MTYAKKLLLLLSVLALLFSLTACSHDAGVTQPTATDPPATSTFTLPQTEPTEPPLTAESLMEQVRAALDGRSLTELALSMEVDLGITVEMTGFRISMDSSLDLDVDAVISEEPYAMYMDISMEAESMGESMADRAEFYYVTENGMLACYTHTLSDNVWTYTEMEPIPEGSDESGEDDADTPMPPLEITLDEQTQRLDRTEVYVLRCTLTAEHLSRFLTPMTGSMITPLEDSQDTLPEDLSATTVIYVDAETRLPVQIQMDITGIEDYLNDMLSGTGGLPSIELSLTSETEEEEEDESGITINTFRIILSGLGFEPVQVPEVPQSAYDYLEMAAHDPDCGDGSYLIVYTGTAALVTPPQDWSVWDAGFDYLNLEHDTQPIYAFYGMYSDMRRQDVLLMAKSEYVTPMEEMGEEVAYSYGEKYGKFEIMEVPTEYGYSLYYAWAPMSEGWLYISVQDMSGGAKEDVLFPLLDAVESHEPLY